jgi:hypothetical protein
MAFCKLIFVLGVSMTIVSSTWAQPTDPASQRLFLTGGSTQRVTLTTPWSGENVRWNVTSDAGVVQQDTTAVDANGRLEMTLTLPSVRSPVKLQWIAKQASPGAGGETAHAQLWLLPDDPFADVRQQLEPMTVHTLLSRKLERLIGAQPVTAAQWNEPQTPLDEEPTVALVEYPHLSRTDSVRQLLTQLSAGSVLIVINRPKATARRHLLTSNDKAADGLQSYARTSSVVWRDLNPTWFTPDLNQHMTVKGHYVSFRLLGGWIDPKERIYPLAMAATDRKGRHVLLWNLAKSIHQDDPRWTLLLRNSLLWAKQTREHQ